MSTGVSVPFTGFPLDINFGSGLNRRDGEPVETALQKAQAAVNSLNGRLTNLDALLEAVLAASNPSYIPLGLIAAANNPAVDAAAIVRQLAASNTSITFLPGATYYMKSRTPPILPVIYQNSTCMLFVGLTNFHVDATGAKFVIDDSIAGVDPTHLDSATSFVGFQNDCHNCSWRGGEFVGNRNGLPASKVSNGFWCSSVERLRLSDLSFTGDWWNGSFVTGVFVFDSVFERMVGASGALGFDMAWFENLEIRNCLIGGGATIANTGISTFTDPNTATNNVLKNPDGSTRALRGNIMNQLYAHDNIIVGFNVGIRIDGVNGSRIEGNTIRDCLRGTTGVYCGILVQVSQDTINAGFYTQDVNIVGNVIFNCGYNGPRTNGAPPANTTGAGIVFATGGQVVQFVTIKDNRIYDNATLGIAQFGDLNLANVEVSGNDWTSRNVTATQSDLIEPQLQIDLGPQLNSFDNRRGYNPVPLTANASGTKGDVVYDPATKNIYRCTAPNHWEFSPSGFQPVPG